MNLHLLSDQPPGGFLAVGDGSISTGRARVNLHKVCLPNRKWNTNNVFIHICCNIHNICLRSLFYVLPLLLSLCGSQPQYRWGLYRFVVDSQMLGLWTCRFQKSFLLCAHWLPCVVSCLFLDFIWLLWDFSHIWYLSVLVWVFWTRVNFPHVVLTLTSTSRVPLGILQTR